MKKKFLLATVMLSLVGIAVFVFFASAGEYKDSDQPMTVTSCDGTKTVIVEGMTEGEVMPREKAQETASLLMSMIKEGCNEHITAKLTDDGPIMLARNDQPISNPAPSFQGKQFSSREMRVWENEMNRVIAEGYKVFHSSDLGTNGISCDMCHPDASNTHPETYPKFQTQLKKIATLREMINWCIENPLEGKTLSHEDPKMIAMETYITSTRKGKTLEPGKH